MPAPEQTTDEHIARVIAETLFGYFDPAETASTSPSQQARLAARAVIELLERW